MRKKCCFQDLKVKVTPKHAIGCTEGELSYISSHYYPRRRMGVGGKLPTPGRRPRTYHRVRPRSGLDGHKEQTISCTYRGSIPVQSSPYRVKNSLSSPDLYLPIYFFYVSAAVCWRHSISFFGGVGVGVGFMPKTSHLKRIFLQSLRCNYFVISLHKLR